VFAASATDDKNSHNDSLAVTRQTVLYGYEKGKQSAVAFCRVKPSQAAFFSHMQAADLLSKTKQN
jgi:hypothetical protein